MDHVSLRHANAGDPGLSRSRFASTNRMNKARCADGKHSCVRSKPGCFHSPAAIWSRASVMVWSPSSRRFTPALKCALAMQSILAASNVGVRKDLHMDARIGAHDCRRILPQRRHLWARRQPRRRGSRRWPNPGGSSSRVPCAILLVPGLDPEVEHVGVCYLKHVTDPVDAYRIQSTTDGQAPALRDLPGRSLSPKIGIIPFEGQFVSPPHSVLGELVADAAIARLSANGTLPRDLEAHHFIAERTCAVARGDRVRSWEPTSLRVAATECSAI